MRSDSESTRGRGRIVRLAAIAIGAGLVLAFPATAGDPYMLTVGITILNYAVLATAWNFVGGFIGYISLGHGALSGLGAYGTALLITAGLPSFVALFVAAAPIGTASRATIAAATNSATKLGMPAAVTSRPVP